MNKYPGDQTGQQGFEEDALREVMEIEQAAQTIIRNAEIESKQIIETAKKEAAALQAEEEERWQRSSQARLEQFKRQVADEADSLGKKAQQQMQAWLGNATRRIPQATAFALQAILLDKSE